MADRPYTLGRWKVKPGHEAEFIDAWKALGEHFGSLATPPGRGLLVQSVDEPSLFYSFGPWESFDAISEMRAHPGTPDAIGKLVALCGEAQPGAFRVVAEA